MFEECFVAILLDPVPNNSSKICIERYTTTSSNFMMHKEEIQK